MKDGPLPAEGDIVDVWDEGTPISKAPTHRGWYVEIVDDDGILISKGTNEIDTVSRKASWRKCR